MDSTLGAHTKGPSFRLDLRIWLQEKRPKILGCGRAGAR